MARKLLPPLIILATIFFIFSPTLFVAPNAQGSSPVISDPPPLPTPTSTRPDDRAAELLKAYKTEDHTAPDSISIASSPVRGTIGDYWADVIIGQPDFSQVTPNEVVGNKLFNPGGVYVDRSVQPNRVYVYDGGNNRILGLSSLGSCAGGGNAGQLCTTDSDCPDSTCPIDPNRPVDIVLGQPNFNTSACNGDSAFQSYPNAPLPTATTLCGMLWNQVSITEGGSAVTMVTDPSGNLYVPDFFNNRILRYDDPFNTDTVADYVWGQPGFDHKECNEGGTPSHSNLCLAPSPGLGMLKSGVEIDVNGNLWVADTQNNRVLRFPLDPILGRPGPTADLVLGQPDFSSKTSGAGLNQLNKPTSVRIDDGGTVYVADGGLGAQQVGRVLVFQSPLTNGMYAANTLGSLAGEPTGLEFAPDGSLWVNESDNKRLLNFLDGSLQVIISNAPTRVWGGLGVDSDGNVMTTGWDPQQVLRYSSPTFNQDVIFLAANEWGSFNEKGPRGFNGLALGLEVTENQLIVGDMGRLLFWNTLDLSNHQSADGVIGQPDLYTNPRWDPVFGRMRADNNGILWVVHGSLAFGYGMHPVIQAYNLPLTTGQPPPITIAPPIPLQGGGYFSWDWSLILAGVDVQPDCDCLWLSDERNHRVFRIREVTTNPTVDIILGQLDASGNECNQGRGRYFPSQDSLCHPGAVTFDNEGNLFVADHNLEFDGNLRLLEWDAALLPSNPSSVIYGIPASRVFGRNNDFTKSDCLVSNPMCAPWEPTFNSQGQMVIGFNSYFGTRFPYVYGNPLADSPTANLFDFHSMPFSARFDQNDNLYILDHNRNRVLIYLQPAFQAGPDIQSIWLPIILK